MASAPLPAWVRDAPDGALLRVHARPGAARSGLQGVHGEALAVRVRARAVEGAANRELVAVLAGALGVPRSAVVVEHGAGGRDKRIRVRGLDAAAVAARLAPQVLP